MCSSFFYPTQLDSQSATKRVLSESWTSPNCVKNLWLFNQNKVVTNNNPQHSNIAYCVLFFVFLLFKNTFYMIFLRISLVFWIPDDCRDQIEDLVLRLTESESRWRTSHKIKYNHIVMNSFPSPFLISAGRNALCEFIDIFIEHFYVQGRNFKTKKKRFRVE